MKIIKSYRLFENKYEIKQDLKDILIELVDYGIRCVVASNKDGSSIMIDFYNSSTRSSFFYKEIKIYLEEISIYLNSKGNYYLKTIRITEEKDMIYTDDESHETIELDKLPESDYDKKIYRMSLVYDIH